MQAQSHQKCVDGMSDQLLELRGANTDQVPGRSTLIGSNISGTCDSSNEAECIASNLIILETKIKNIVEDNISTGDAGLRSENLLAISILNADPSYSMQGSFSS